jgi:hypothetical protein
MGVVNKMIGFGKKVWRFVLKHCTFSPTPIRQRR